MSSTVNVVDPRIENEAPPVYLRTIAPKQNQFYKVPASGKSNSFLTFNNLTTLGADRAFLDTFELELTAKITFVGDSEGAYKPNVDEWVFDSFPFAKCCESVRANVNGGYFMSQPLSYLKAKERYWNDALINASYENICPCNKPHLQNEMGVDFSSSGASEEDIAKKMEMYVATKGAVARTYQTTVGSSSSIRVRPYIPSGDNGELVVAMGNGNGVAIPARGLGHTNRTLFGDVSALVTGSGDGQGTQIAMGYDYGCAGVPYAMAAGRYFTTEEEPATVNDIDLDLETTEVGTHMDVTGVTHGAAAPTRLACSSAYAMPCASGLIGAHNNAIVRAGAGNVNYQWKENGRILEVIVTWREPVFCPPFSTRIDATFGRPLYNITSIDLAFNMQDLGNMIRVAHLRGEHYVQSYTVDILGAQLCYQVETLPPGMPAPASTVVPYRQFTPYITDFPENADLPPGGRTVTQRTGVYTINEVPTAIYLFAAPTKNLYQTNPPDSSDDKLGVIRHGCWASNKLFGYIKHVSISMANTTQILNTADLPDLYRIAKNNGCQDSFKQWGIDDAIDPRLTTEDGSISLSSLGPGSVLRLVPGTDIVLPEQELIPGTNANNMVFQAEVTYTIPPHSPNLNSYALWVLFEYVGVARLTPGQCEISMNPLGNGEGFARSPTVAAPTNLQPSAEGEVSEGSGFWDKVKNFFKKTAAGVQAANQYLKDNHSVSTIAGQVGGLLGKFSPTAGAIANNIAARAGEMGYGLPGMKRMRVDGGAFTGGAVMGLGDFT